MIPSLEELHPVLQAFLATCFTWGVTALGAAVVFLTKQATQRSLGGMLGFASGVMIAASFWYGQMSGMVEPIAGVMGAATVLFSQQILPYALSFAAGAMIFVVVEDAIPEAERGGHTDLATMGAMLGFVVMMIPDVALG